MTAKRSHIDFVRGLCVVQPEGGFAGQTTCARRLQELREK